MGTTWRLISRTVLAAAVLAACSDDDGDGPPDASPAERTGDQVARGTEDTVLVEASPQRSDGATVLVDRVVLDDGGGYVVIYADGDGAPGRQLGVSTRLEPGTSEDIAVQLDDPLEETAAVHAMVHREDNGNDAFDFPAADQPATLDDGIVEVAFEVEVVR